MNNVERLAGSFRWLLWLSLVVLALLSLVLGLSVLNNNVALSRPSRTGFVNSLDHSVAASTDWTLGQFSLGASGELITTDLGAEFASNPALVHMLVDTAAISGDARLRQLSSKIVAAYPQTDVGSMGKMMDPAIAGPPLNSATPVSSVTAPKARERRKSPARASVRRSYRSRDSPRNSAIPAARCRPIPAKSSPTRTSPTSTRTCNPGQSPPRPRIFRCSINKEPRKQRINMHCGAGVSPAVLFVSVANIAGETPAPRKPWGKRHQRGCVTTSTSAGSPRFTTAIARRIAGPRSLGSVIGPFGIHAHALGHLGVIDIRIGDAWCRSARVMPRLWRLAMRCTCITS